MYLDGKDALNFAKNVWGMVTRFGVSTANRVAWGIPSIATMAKWSLPYAWAVFPGAMTKIAAITGNPLVIGLTALGGVAAVTYLWNVRAFY